MSVGATTRRPNSELPGPARCPTKSESEAALHARATWSALTRTKQRTTGMPAAGRRPSAGLRPSRGDVGSESTGPEPGGLGWLSELEGCVP
jgi:hypothetical protein